MFGALIGDIVGSIYEWDPIKTKTFEFFGRRCRFTDDSVCTAAVAEILLDDAPVAATLQSWCRRYPGRGYGGYFRGWIQRPDPQPYGSFGNGAAMRVSPAAFLNRNRPLDEALAASDRVTAVTHNHPEGIKGARAATQAIWLAFQGEAPDEIRRRIAEEYDYDMDRTVDQIRPSHTFNATCQKTVPEALTCALESTSFEDAVRNAISLGGDSDTLGAIAGPIAEAMHGVPTDLVATAKSYLAEAPEIVTVLERTYRSVR